MGYHLDDFDLTTLTNGSGLPEHAPSLDDLAATALKLKAAMPPPPIRLQLAPHVPLEREEPDGTRKPVLGWTLNLDDEILVLVHPDRWAELKAWLPEAQHVIEHTPTVSSVVRRLDTLASAARLAQTFRRMAVRDWAVFYLSGAEGSR